MKSEDQKIIDILTQIAEGKEFEYFSNADQRWKGSLPTSLRNALDWLADGATEIRIKPAPKMRPLRVDELHPVEIFKESAASLHANIWNTVGIGKEALERCILKSIELGKMRSLDYGNTWQTFEVACQEGEPK